MTSLALALVLSSAVLHALWNLLYKRARDKPSFAFLFGVSATVIYLPVFLLMVGGKQIVWQGLAVAVLSAFVHTLYFTFLGRGYSVGDLSLVYPLARGTGPLLVPIWATIFLGERITAIGLVGILAVVGGVYIIHLRELSLSGLLAPLRSLSTRPTQIAIFSGLLISIYTVVDRVGVGYMDPVIYMYVWTALFTAMYGPYVYLTSGPVKIRTEWRDNRIAIVAVGILMVLTYTMVLFAMTMSNVSYVAAAREIAVVFGAAMGTVMLRESYGRSKMGGSLLIALGVALIGMAKG
ncbi:MAG TPA: DMT family transporter [Chloroflexota bacterium]|nr:DMT family transporter [Chloroflexota bacterium]